MNNIKYTGANIAAAILVLFYFFSWVNLTAISMSGFSLTSNGISPGMMAYFINGSSRFFLILAILVPLGGAVILYQNVTANKRFEKYYKPAHFIPAIYFVIGIIGLYFKMKPEAPSAEDSAMFPDMARSMREMTPGPTDVLSFGVYISLAAALYLLLVSMGKIKDKEYYKPAATVQVKEEKENVQ